MKLTQKRIGFVQDYFKEVPPGAAYMAHYRVKSMAVASSCATKLLKNADIQAYLQELRDKADSDAVMNRQEILERHSVIGRAELIDFTKGGEPSLDRKTPNHPAASEFSHRLSYNKAGVPIVTKTIKLHDPVRSMQEIAKLQGYYPKEERGGDTYNDIKVIIVREKPKEIGEEEENSSLGRG